MSDLVDWASPEPAEEVDTSGTTDSDSGNQEHEDTSPDTETETGAVGVSKEPANTELGDKELVKAAPSKDNTDTKREDTQKPETKASPQAPRLIDVNGEMLSEAELITRASKVQGSDKRFEEAARVRKQQQAFVDRLRTDPLAVLSDSRIGIDRKALGEKLLMEELEREAADPRDTELAEYKAKEALAAKAEEQRVEQEKEADFQRQIDQKKTEVADVIGKAMENTVLSSNPQIAGQVLREMATYMRSAKQQGIDLTPDELVQHVETSRYAGYRTLANGLEGEQLIEFMGKDVVNKIRKADLKRLKGKNTPKQKAPSTSPVEKKKKERKIQDPYEAARNAKY
tara:strand:- start:10 stop:1035 length:1026 start_codon:yes stop_codon:yes gene_type:complete